MAFGKGNRLYSSFQPLWVVSAKVKLPRNNVELYLSIVNEKCKKCFYLILNPFGDLYIYIYTVGRSP